MGLKDEKAETISVLFWKFLVCVCVFGGTCVYLLVGAKGQGWGSSSVNLYHSSEAESLTEPGT